VRTVVVASDSAAVRAEVIATIAGPDLELLEAHNGAQVLELVAEYDVELAILDLQMSNMGGMAVTLELRLEESYDQLLPTAVLLLCDRRADVHLARRSGAEGFIVKPLDGLRLRRAVAALLAGDGYEDPSFAPVPILVTDPQPA